MTLTVEQIRKIFPNNKNFVDLTNSLNSILPKYEINTKERICSFLAQCGHESMGFTVMAENLFYSKEGLVKVFKKYFTESDASLYAKKPEMIASRVYANRMGNGDEKSKEGYLYRGRGYIQLTGKNNYQAFATAIGKPLDETVKYCETVAGALESACWYWKINNLNEWADKKDLVTMTKKINNGLLGFADRQNIYNRALAVIV